jgi:hypothetical protein
VGKPPAYADDRHERAVMLTFRIWRRIRPLLRSTSSARMANTYSVSGFILAAAALAVGVYAWPAFVVAGLAMFAGIGYGLDGYVKRVSMRLAAGHDSNINARDFLNAPRSPDEGFRLVHPANGSRSQLYPYVDLSDHSLFIQAENDLTRDQRYALYERWYDLCPNGFMHLEKREGDRWRPISVSILLPLSGAGYRSITAQSEAHRLSVVDLGVDGIQPRVTSKNPFLLIDTWIVDREGGFGGAGHGKSDIRGGNANLLVLRHLTLFWNPATRLKHLSILVETANRHLVRALEMLSFRQSGTSNIDEAFYQTSPMQFDAMAPGEFAALKAALIQIGAVDVVTGTAPAPIDWYYK